ncbi:hypothetical protein [Telluribacter sp.]|jgi:hypothetical protein|uniref:hypothetical protein n=1 Tax=Telluribacter sp. TaxID=1978767 RepID=UPI002E1642A0|nr:hypothetical protein [Telluribacter sp.]
MVAHLELIAAKVRQIDERMFFLVKKMYLSLQGQIGTTSSCRIPQVLTEARVGGRSGEILGLPFFVSHCFPIFAAIRNNLLLYFHEIFH